MTLRGCCNAKPKPKRGQPDLGQPDAAAVRPRCKLDRNHLEDTNSGALGLGIPGLGCCALLLCQVAKGTT